MSNLGDPQFVRCTCVRIVKFVYDRYYVGTDWQPKKLDVEVEVPLTLDLESLRSTGMQVRCGG